ncbi:MAG: stage V sporulation protein AE [Oscillospiraceae bacterium]|jgi:stage V sporulation protein AE|nr:stage V sporulation protein AE [Oscillospiraceae bacterium]
MEIFLQYLKAFVVGGLLCAAGQIIIDKTKLTPARILTAYVVIGVLLGAVGVYKPLVKWAGAGAAVPLTGFGYALSEGVRRAVSEKGILGAFTGGLSGTAGGIAAAVVFAMIFALVTKPHDKLS